MNRSKNMAGLVPASPPGGGPDFGTIGTPLGYRQPYGMDLAASSAWRFTHGGNEYDVKAAVEAIGGQVSGNLPLRSFAYRVGWDDVGAVPQQRVMTFNDWVFVYAYTASVAGVEFTDAQVQWAGAAQFNPRDFVLVAQQTTSNELGIITAPQSPQQNFAPISEVYGVGGSQQYILPQAFQRATALQFQVVARANVGISNIKSVSITVHYLRIPSL